MSVEERKARERERYREAMADPEKRERILSRIYRYKRRVRAEIKADPELHAAYLADERIRRRVESGEPLAPLEFLRPAVDGYDDDSREWVDPEPFIAYLNETFGALDTRDLEPILKIDSHRLNDLRRQRRVSLSVVDHVLTAGLGRPDLLNALYPMEGTQ